MRAKLRKEQIPFPAVSNVPGDTIALCTSVPDSNQLWVGYTSGKIHVYTYVYLKAFGNLDYKFKIISFLSIIFLKLFESIGINLMEEEEVWK